MPVPHPTKVKFIHHTHDKASSVLEQDLELTNTVNAHIAELEEAGKRILFIEMSTTQCVTEKSEIAHCHDILIAYED